MISLLGYEAALERAIFVFEGVPSVSAISIGVRRSETDKSPKQILLRMHFLLRLLIMLSELKLIIEGLFLFNCYSNPRMVSVSPDQKEKVKT